MVTLPILFIFAEHRDRDAKRGTLSALLEIRIKGRMVGELCVYFLSVDFKKQENMNALNLLLLLLQMVEGASFWRNMDYIRK